MEEELAEMLDLGDPINAEPVAVTGSEEDWPSGRGSSSFSPHWRRRARRRATTPTRSTDRAAASALEPRVQNFPTRSSAAC